MSHEQQNRTAGDTMAPQGIPEQIRITLLATVTERLIELRRQEPDEVRTFELSRLIPAAEWLTGDSDQAGRFLARGATYQYEIEAVHVDYSGSVCRVDDDSQANTFGVYRRPITCAEIVARAEFVGDFDTRHAAQQAASAMAVQDAGGAGGH